VATKGVQKGQSRREGTENTACLHPPPNPLSQIHRSKTSNGGTLSCHPLLGHAIMQIFESIQNQNKKIKQLYLQNIIFIQNGNIIPHKLTKLKLAACISITFERQKNDRKSDKVMQWRPSDPIVCPVKTWLSIVSRILSYKGTMTGSPVSLAFQRNKLISITSEMIADLI
jgi:hypothetical protein